MPAEDKIRKNRLFFPVLERVHKDFLFWSSKEVIRKVPTEKKAKKISELEETFSKSKAGVITDYRGIRTPALTALRVKLRQAGLEIKIVKNTLARQAVEKAGKPDLKKIFEGPTAVTLSYKDDVTAAKVITEYVRATRDTPIKIRGGFLGASLISAAEVTILATLPPRDMLIARVLGGMQAPIARLVGQLAAPLQGFIGVLEARRKQLEEAGAQVELK